MSFKVFIISSNWGLSLASYYQQYLISSAIWGLTSINFGLVLSTLTICCIYFKLRSLIV